MDVVAGAGGPEKAAETLLASEKASDKDGTAASGDNVSGNKTGAAFPICWCHERRSGQSLHIELSTPEWLLMIWLFGRTT